MGPLCRQLGLSARTRKAVISASKIVLLDGPSCSGKSGARSTLLELYPELVFCRRVTTRPRRESESDADYRFITTDEFQELEQNDGLAAWRHFEFGMSYGLPKDPVEAAVRGSRPVLCLIDLGTVEQAKSCWPHATGVLLYAPLEQLERRLRARRSHSEAQIQERLENAERVWEKRHLYDHVILNRDGEWDQTIEALGGILDPVVP